MSEPEARKLIAATGGRQTQPRIQALTALLSNPRAQSHAELQEQLPAMDRVSLYRALDWLTDQGLAFRITDTSGVRRYGPSQPDQHHHHPHFQCTACGMTTCLEQDPNPHVELPTGYRLTDVVVLVKGLCKTCNAK